MYFHPKLLIYPSPAPSTYPSVTISLFSMSVGLFLLCKCLFVSLLKIRFHIWVISYICLSLSDLLYLVWSCENLFQIFAGMFVLKKSDKMGIVPYLGQRALFKYFHLWHLINSLILGLQLQKTQETAFNLGESMSSKYSLILQIYLQRL